MDFVINEHFPDVAAKTHKYLVSNRFSHKSLLFFIPQYCAMNLFKNSLHVLFLVLQEFFSKVVSMTAELIANWQSVGFAHGEITAAVKQCSKLKI